MTLSERDLHILTKLVGHMSTDKAEHIRNKIDCFFHPEVSLFIPATGQCEYAITPSHTHPAYSFIYYFQPTDSVFIEGKRLTYDLMEGKCLCAISPEIPHQEIEQEGFHSYIAIMIDAKLFEEVVIQYVGQVPVFYGETFVPHPELLAILRCFMLEIDNGRETELLNHLAHTIVHLAALSVVADTQNSIHLYDRFEVDTAIAYMNSNYAEKITNEVLAQLVNRSPGHFSKVFKTITGTTPIEFLNTIRIQKARNMLLNSTKNITEIALECGFNTSSYFSSCFLEKYSMTPSSYRQNFQTKN